MSESFQQIPVKATVLERRTFIKIHAFLPILIAGCASKTPALAYIDEKLQFWTGRISLQIQSEPAQTFFASFELTGQAERGELLLTSPLGTTLARMRWTPNQADLETSQGTRTQYRSIDALLEKNTGAAIPVLALFDWLAGQKTLLNGWSADLSKLPRSLTAQRSEPAPAVSMRILIDQDASPIQPPQPAK